ncbi:hypothetical protein PG991_014730 [Apiospora marii]|uniref:Uncharacterized protein n=1 Tax=Apiospora marii TaxID=335849 RepID=A0ABR1R4E1_9PEZI
MNISSLLSSWDSGAGGTTPRQPIAPFTNATPSSMNEMAKPVAMDPLSDDENFDAERLPPSSSTSRLSASPGPRPQPSQPIGMDHSSDDETLGAARSPPSHIANAIATFSSIGRPDDDIPWESFLGSQAPQQSQANVRANLENLLSVNEHEIAPADRLETPLQMSCELMPHQRVGLTWLVKQEKSNRKGALLADTMGLGKTIQALALMLAHQSNNDSRKTTLIVAPLALLKQWEAEIRQKVERHYRLKTFIYHGLNKKGMTAAKLMKYDVVLTTYGTIGHEFRRKRNYGILAEDAMFYRIILDEAHNIKNRRSTTSEAVCKIKGTYRICMTGTPFMNNTSEIYSLIRFLRIEPYRWWEEFSQDIDRPIRKWEDDEHSEAMRRLRALIWSFTMRRSKHSVLDGVRILNLPTKEIVEVKAEFNEDQANFYNALEASHRDKFEKYSNSRSKKKNYMAILVLILRLRQVCSHPHLIKNFGIPDGAELDSDGMTELALDLSPAVVEQVCSQPSFTCPICDELTIDPLIIAPCGHHICCQCFTAVMQVNVLEGRDAGAPGISDTTCPHDGCTSEILPDRVICYTYFVRAHGPGVARIEGAGGDDSETCESETEDEEGTPNKRLKREGLARSGPMKQEVKQEGAQESRSSIVKTEEASSSLPALSSVPDRGLQGGNVKREDTEAEAAQDPLKGLEDFMDAADSLLARGRATMIRGGKFNPTPAPAIDAARSSPPKRPIKSEPGSASPSSQPRSAKRSKKNDGGYKEKKKVITLADLKRESQRNATAKAAYLQRLRKDWVSSAKIDATMELLRRLRDEKPDEKILVFSLWTSFLDLLEVPLHDGKFTYARYDGSMKPQARDEAVKQFAREPAASGRATTLDSNGQRSIGTRVLLVSLTAGNAGLNLTAASQVVVLEPFWNPFVEDQAVDRAHRIGQRRAVTVHRVLVAGTVEDRILELQERKRRLVGAALSEEGARGIGRLSLQELRGLFGVR